MPEYGMSVRKTAPWRDNVEAFTNVYHFTGPELEEAVAESLIGEVVTVELQLFDLEIEITGAKVWGPLGVPATSQMIAIVDYDPPRSSSNIRYAALYRECAFEVRWPLPRSAKGYKRYLKKYWHSAQTSTSFSEQMAEGQTEIDSGTRSEYEGHFQNIRNGFLTEGYDLSGPDGSLPQGDPFCVRYLNHRQFHQGS